MSVGYFEGAIFISTDYAHSMIRFDYTILGGVCDADEFIRVQTTFRDIRIF